MVDATRLNVCMEPSLQQFVLKDVSPTGIMLGTGSYGSVEEVKYNHLVCAGKRLHESLVEAGNDGVEDVVKKYLLECELMANLRHPNITQFLGICFLPGSKLPLLVMERLDTSLDDLLEGVPNLPLSLKASILEDVASGLIYLHERSPAVIHRDLTARNVLLTSSLVAKITDMGNSRIIDTRPGQMVRTLSRLPGSLLYMPPEALDEGQQYGPPLDVFSFGHLALFTVTQKFPGNLLRSTYPNPNNLEGVLGRTEVERREGFFQLMEAGIGQSHPSLVQLVKQCLHNAPLKRPTTDELLTRLQGIRRKVEAEHPSAIAKLEVTRRRLRGDYDLAPSPVLTVQDKAPIPKPRKKLEYNTLVQSELPGLDSLSQELKKDFLLCRSLPSIPGSLEDHGNGTPPALPPRGLQARVATRTPALPFDNHTPPAIPAKPRFGHSTSSPDLLPPPIPAKQRIQRIKQAQNSDDDDDEANLKDKEWYWGRTSFVPDIISKLEGSPDGTFLVRDSVMQSKGKYILIVRNDEANTCINISESSLSDGFRLMNISQPSQFIDVDFASIPALIEYFRYVPLSVGGVTVSLVHPLSRLESRDLPAHSYRTHRPGSDPTAHLKSAHKVTLSKKLHKEMKDWFCVDGAMAEEMLWAKPNGTFLCRPLQNRCLLAHGSHHSAILDVMCNGVIKHFDVLESKDKFGFSLPTTFSSLMELVLYHSAHPLPEPHKTTLQYPINCRHNRGLVP